MDVVEAFLQPTRTHPKHPSDTTFPTVLPDPPIIERAGAGGERTLWVVFVLMVIAAVIFGGLAWTVPASKRLYHSITTTIVVTAALSYFAMATGDGISWHTTRIRHSHDNGIPDTFQRVHRQVYYARYIDWAITTPLLLLDLGLLAGLNGASIFSAVVADVIMVLTGLFAAFGHGKRQKWGWYAIGCLAYLWILYTLVLTGRNTVQAKGAKTARFYNLIAGYTLILWTAYPVIWAIADGTRHINVTSEIIAYAVLDVLAKGVFGGWLLFTHRSLPESHVDLDGFWSHGLSGEGTIRIQEEEEGA